MKNPFLIYLILLFSFSLNKPCTLQAQDHALRFDGLDDVVLINKYMDLHLDSTDFTIEALVNIRPKARDLYTLLTNSSLAGWGGVFVWN